MLFSPTCAGPPRHRRRSSWTRQTRRPSPERRRSEPGIVNSHFSVQFVPHCHNLSEQYWLQVGCAKFNLICTDVGGGGLFGTTKRFLQYCFTTIVTLVYFCSQGYRNIKIQRQMWTFGSPQHLEWRGTSSWPSALFPVSPRGPGELESLLRDQSSDQATPALHVWSEISKLVRAKVHSFEHFVIVQVKRWTSNRRGRS